MENTMRIISIHAINYVVDNNTLWNNDDWANIRSRIFACQQRTAQAIQQLEIAHNALNECNLRLLKAKVVLHEVNALIPSSPSKDAYWSGSYAALK